MSDYKVPLDDILFTLEHIADLPRVTGQSAFEHADTDTIASVLGEAARFVEDVIAPTCREGDTVGSVRNDDGSVTTPPSFPKAYQQYVDAGWGAVPGDPGYGGGGFPYVVGLAIQEMMTTANMAFTLCPLLTQGAVDALRHHGSEELRETYLPKLITGEWTGTMNLTEPNAGSDVGALTAKAVKAADGSYRITGQKIFITYGEHDLTDNIIHLVLARTPDAPPGTKGISLFIVPKVLVDDDGSLGDGNDVTCVSIEHKLGIHASPTCVLAFGDDGDGAIGYLVGDENAGMRYMFTMMNRARVSVGLEGLGVAERAFQLAKQYAHDRPQGRAPGAAAGTSSPIVDHPDVQRMLLDMKAAVEAMRAIGFLNGAAIDLAEESDDDATREAGDELAALLTPLTKSWCTDTGVEMASLGVQVHGGMGFVEETGAAQHFRDARIAPIYEGTNGIQAMDLVARKLPMRGGGVVKDHLASLGEIAGRLEARPDLEVVRRHLDGALEAVSEASDWLLANLQSDPRAALAGATAYLEMLAVTTAGALLAKGALAAPDALPAEAAEDKAVIARHFAVRWVARVPALVAAVTGGDADLAAARERLLAI